MSLKDCPFCGSPAELSKEARGEDTLDEVWVIACINCSAEMVGDRYEGQASYVIKDDLLQVTEEWNTRLPKEISKVTKYEHAFNIYDAAFSPFHPGLHKKKDS